MEYVLTCSGMESEALPATPVVFGAVGLLTEGYAGWAPDPIPEQASTYSKDHQCVFTELNCTVPS